MDASGEKLILFSKRGGMMSIDWNEIKKVVFPIKEYEDLYKRLSASFSHPFVLKTFNFTLPKMIAYTRSLLGG
jgi:hypothetical protein